MPIVRSANADSAVPKMFGKCRTRTEECSTHFALTFRRISHECPHREFRKAEVVTFHARQCCLPRRLACAVWVGDAVERQQSRVRLGILLLAWVRGKIGFQSRPAL